LIAFLPAAAPVLAELVLEAWVEPFGWGAACFSEELGGPEAAGVALCFGWGAACFCEELGGPEAAGVALCFGCGAACFCEELGGPEAAGVALCFGCPPPPSPPAADLRYDCETLYLTRHSSPGWMFLFIVNNKNNQNKTKRVP
jgi:hypothetical protein